MKRMFSTVATVLTVMVVAPTITAQEPETPALSDGLGLYAFCKGDAPSARAMCHGFVMGAIDAATELSGNGRPNACIESGVTNGQIVDVVRKYLEEHPAIRHRASVKLVLAAVTSAFCKTPTKK